MREARRFPGPGYLWENLRGEKMEVGKVEKVGRLAGAGSEVERRVRIDRENNKNK
jgi:hypothetical protein